MYLAIWIFGYYDFINLVMSLVVIWDPRDLRMIIFEFGIVLSTQRIMFEFVWFKYMNMIRGLVWSLSWFYVVKLRSKNLIVVRNKSKAVCNIYKVSLRIYSYYKSKLRLFIVMTICHGLETLLLEMSWKLL